jgi:hypothetical protein
MEQAHLLVVVCVAFGAAGCAKDVPPLDVSVLAVATPKAAAQTAASAIVDIEYAQLAFDLPDRSNTPTLSVCGGTVLK